MSLIGIGGAHIDRIGRTDGPHLPRTSNPGRLRETTGGGCFNAQRVAALRQAGCLAIVSARGNDSAGGRIKQAIEEAGIADLSCVSKSSSTATYTAILDQSGELITALADMAIYDETLTQHINQQNILFKIADAKAVLVDANISESSLTTICQFASGPVFGIAISASKITRLKAVAKTLDVVFMNHHEARHLTGERDIHRAALACVATIGFKNVVVTQGDQPVLIVQGGELWSMAVQEAQIVDVTGAGDALCGGTLAALLRDDEVPLTQAVREGMACASLTLGHDGPLCPAIATDAFHTALAKIQTPTRLSTRNA